MKNILLKIRYIIENIKYPWIQCTMCGCSSRRYRFKKEPFEKLWYYKGKIILCCQCQVIKNIDTRILEKLVKLNIDVLNQIIKERLDIKIIR